MLLNRGFADYIAAKTEIERAIVNYNTLRPHGSCNYYTPEQAHQMEGELAKKWRVSRRWEAEKVQQNESIFVAKNEP